MTSDVSGRLTWPVALIILIAGLAAYSNSFHGEFVFDDAGSIAQNATLDSFKEALAPPKGAETVSGRPILNLSLAINYRLHGVEVTGYHVVNLIFHLAAGLTLFGLVRRTLMLESMRDRFGDAATWVAGAVALIWTVHPLQTESVSYIVQRAESLGGLFYLLVLYCFVRGATAASGRSLWMCGALIASLVGIGTKETLVSAPVIVLLYDRAFVAGSFTGAMRERWKVHTALAVITWGALGCLMWSNAQRGGTAGLGLAIGSVDYARTQVAAIAMYLKLSVWPTPLVLDYGVPVVRSWGEIVPQTMLVAVLVLATLWTLLTSPKVGFVMAAFFACLAPTSSFVPVTTQTMAEHRMYLALAAEVALLLCIPWLIWKKPGEAVDPALRVAMAGAGCIVAVVMAVVLAMVTQDRNRDYRTALSIWSDTIAKRPGNARAYNGVGQALKDQRRFDEALAYYTRAIELEPAVAKWRNNRGNAHYEMQEYKKAIADYNGALKLDENLKGAYVNRAVAWFFLREYENAWADVRRAEALGAQPHPEFVKALEQASKTQSQKLAETPVEPQ